MAIQRTTTNIGLSILERGTPGWGILTNQNMDLVDQAFGLDRARITSLENETAALPIALAAKIGHNLLNNNIFSRPVASDPSIAAGWTSAFANGAIGYTSRDTSTYLIGRGGSQAATSQRVSITNVNLTAQIRPYPGLNVLDPVSKQVLATNDARQLTNAFGYVFQPVILSAKTTYTLSCYGKPEIPTSNPPINVHWKIGIVFKSGSNILHSYFSAPQMNYTSDINTGSFDRAELTFETPDLPVVQAEVWLITGGNTPGGIGSCYFDGVQLEQSTRATALDTFAARNGDLSIPGDLIVGGNLKLQQDQLVFEGSGVVFTGNVQIGDDTSQDILDVFTKIATFYGPVKILGDTIIGDSPTEDQVNITASKTTFFNNQDTLSPQGGDVEIQGDLVVKGNTTLGNSNADVVTINASLVTAFNDLDIGGNVDISGSLNVARAVTLGSNQATDRLTILMGLGTDMQGNVSMQDNLTVAHSVEIGTAGTCSLPSADTFQVHAGSATFDGSVAIGKGLTVGGTGAPCPGGPIELHTDGHDFELTSHDIKILGGSGNTTWQTLAFDLSGSLDIGSNIVGQYLNANVENIVLGSSTLTSSATLAVNAINSNFSGNLSNNRNSSIAGGLTVGGAAYGTATGPADSKDSLGYKGEFLFGTALLNASRPFVSFKPNVSLATATPYVGQPAIGGEIVFGDPNALQLVGGRRTYSTTLNVFAGKTNFGTTGLGAGQENVGDVEISGNLQVHGSTILGNDTTTDTVEIKAYHLLINSSAPGDGYANATVRIGGGFQNVSWTPTEYASGKLDGNRGGISINNNGDLWMDGKLTVKGPIDPIELIVTPLTDPVQTNAIVVKLGNTTETFKVSKQGAIWAKETLSLNDGATAYISSSATTFATGSNPLTNFSVYALSTSLSGNLAVEGSFSVDQAQIYDLDVTNDALIGGDLVLTGSFTTYGNQTTIGNSTVGSRLDVLVDTLVFGTDGSSRGNVTIGNDLVVRHDIALGSGSPDVANFNFDSINIAVASDRLLLAPQQIVSGAKVIELKGFRIGGGYQNNVYNSSQLDHGGVTIDPYGNIYADGSVFANGELGFNRLTLTAPLGTDLCDPFLVATNKVLNEDVFVLDNLGNIQADGYYFIHDKNINNTCAQPASQTYPNSAAAMFRVIHDSSPSNDTVFEIDNAGNTVLDGYLTTKIPGGSTLATASATVGTGTQSIGDFNQVGHNNASSDPIQAALTYAAGLPSGRGKILIKKGTYTVPTAGWVVPSNVSIEGEGADTLLQATTGVIFTMYNNSSVRNLRTTGGTVGVTVASNQSNVTIADITLSATTALQVQSGTSNIYVRSVVASRTGSNSTALNLSGPVNIINSTFTGYAQGGTIAGSNVLLSECTIDAQGSTPTVTTIPASWSALSTGFTNNQISALAIFNDTLYAGGTFTTAGGSPANYLAQWTGSSWVAVGSLNSPVTSMAVYNNELYIGGQFSGAITRYNGSVFNTVGPLNSINGQVYALQVYNNELYIGGTFSSVTGLTGASRIVKWDGSTYTRVGSANDLNDTVSEFGVYNNNLYIGGSFTNAAGISGANYVAQWNGSTYSLVGTASAFNGNVGAFATYNGNLYIGGNFTAVAGIASTRGVVQWNNASFSSIGSFSSDVYALCAHDGELYIGGAFTNAGGISGANKIVRWNNAALNLVGASNSISNGWVTSMISFNSSLVVGGDFTDAGSIATADRVVQFTPTYLQTTPTQAFDIQGANNRIVNCNILGYYKGITTSSTATETNIVDNIIVGDPVAALVGLDIGGNRTLLRGNRISNFEDYGIRTTANNGTIIENYLTTDDATIISIAANISGNENNFNNNIILNTDQGVIVSGLRNSIRNNNIQGAFNSSPGLTLAGSAHIASSNTITGFTTRCVEVLADLTQVDNNTVTGSNTGIYCAANNVALTGNKLSSYITTGIDLTGSGCIISHNRLPGGALTGIKVVGNENLVNNNYVVDHSTDGISILGNDCIAVGNITLRNPT